MQRSRSLCRFRQVPAGALNYFEDGPASHKTKELKAQGVMPDTSIVFLQGARRLHVRGGAAGAGLFAERA